MLSDRLLKMAGIKTSKPVDPITEKILEVAQHALDSGHATTPEKAIDMAVQLLKEASTTAVEPDDIVDMHLPPPVRFKRPPSYPRQHDEKVVVPIDYRPEVRTSIRIKGSNAPMNSSLEDEKKRLKMLAKIGETTLTHRPTRAGHKDHSTTKTVQGGNFPDYMKDVDMLGGVTKSAARPIPNDADSTNSQNSLKESDFVPTTHDVELAQNWNSLSDEEKKSAAKAALTRFKNNPSHFVQWSKLGGKSYGSKHTDIAASHSDHQAAKKAKSQPSIKSMDDLKYGPPEIDENIKERLQECYRLMTPEEQESLLEAILAEDTFNLRASGHQPSDPEINIKGHGMSKNDDEDDDATGNTHTMTSEPKNLVKFGPSSKTGTSGITEIDHANDDEKNPPNPEGSMTAKDIEIPTEPPLKPKGSQGKAIVYPPTLKNPVVFGLSEAGNRVCSWCNTTMGPATTEKDTHGICPGCASKMKSDYLTPKSEPKPAKQKEEPGSSFGIPAFATEELTLNEFKTLSREKKIQMLHKLKLRENSENVVRVNFNPKHGNLYQSYYNLKDKASREVLDNMSDTERAVLINKLKQLSQTHNPKTGTDVALSVFPSGSETSTIAKQNEESSKFLQENIDSAFKKLFHELNNVCQEKTAPVTLVESLQKITAKDIKEIACSAGLAAFHPHNNKFEVSAVNTHKILFSLMDAVQVHSNKSDIKRLATQFLKEHKTRYDIIAEKQSVELNKKLIF
jgi:hypothetical protein